MRVDNWGLVHGTPVEEYGGVWYKREDLCAPEPGPSLAKYRGIVLRLQRSNESVVGVLDGHAHTKNGWAVAFACSHYTDKKCLDFYVLRKGNTQPGPYQERARLLGAQLYPLPTSDRFVVVWYRARKMLPKNSLMLPNALKLEETVEAEAKEAAITPRDFATVVVPTGTATLASGVVRGFRCGPRTQFVLHLGYSRSEGEVVRYVRKMSGVERNLAVVDENFPSGSKVEGGPPTPFPLNPWYERKAHNWMMANLKQLKKPVLFWVLGS